MIYDRRCSLMRSKLENNIKSLYDSQWCEITSSGLNAISMVLYSLFCDSTDIIDNHMIFETPFGERDSVDHQTQYDNGILYLRINVGYDDENLITKIDSLIKYLKEL